MGIYVQARKINLACEKSFEFIENKILLWDGEEIKNAFRMFFELVLQIRPDSYDWFLCTFATIEDNMGSEQNLISSNKREFELIRTMRIRYLEVTEM